MLKNFIILILKGVRHRPIRSWLTILGIIIGVMLVIMILSLSAGVQNAISSTLQMFGSDLIIIFPGKETNPIAGILAGQKFKEQDIMDLENIEGVDSVAPMTIGTLNVDFKGEKKSVAFHASYWDKMKSIFEESRGVKLEIGAWPQNEDANEVVLGYLAANSLFKNKIQAGDEIIVQSKRLKVSGIMARLGIQEDDNSMYMSWNMFHNISGLKPGVMSALVRVVPGGNIEFIAQQIRFQLQKQEVVRDFSVLSPEKAGRIVGDILSIVELVLLLIAMVSLLVGAVGIMNTIYTSVLERTKQIGIMKAIGASSESILMLFLIESGVIGIIGGVLGVVVGIIFAWIAGFIASRFGINGLFSFASLDFFGFFAILIITFITGIVSGILPARQAAKMEPAEALRYE
ncbi:MAG: hypothetical protein US71_C0001G0014 [Parcubacteria group bacterium GW2011_GWD2_38_12]|nr:MAG: hypothetical protein US06_C0001G0014 [Parcubacteria group bacterium GW2011_GWC2_36_17]KKQ40291.1 MAG: hypothetical protein US56_C0006G0008 [Candidatus Moranbacteria bacterium GW2011_GWF2_37_7]KKQ52811.1 MAG: hypothetical protein US71_C0001G0014 [Parcubacteria group bacterium GW2011_GWD2_38_12]KKQ59015.1 MAG: hypothetical protein US79_C0001G0014 [Parcubacteria group bacterium GW2011_GWC1_38_17]KKQ59251.1 MAG: hypothetical protein US78_C0007G0011 [Parcubacteria group bacterium GW2011_GWD1